MFSKVFLINLLSTQLKTEHSILFRYLAVSKPIEYRMATIGISTSKRGARYMIPTTVFSILFNLPKFWELEIKAKDNVDNANNSIADETEMNIILDATDLRKNPTYSFVYVHLIQFFVKGIIPFGALLVLNLGIYR